MDFMELNRPLFVVGFEITAHLDPDAPDDASRGETTTPSFISFPCIQERRVSRCDSGRRLWCFHDMDDHQSTVQRHTDLYHCHSTSEASTESVPHRVRVRTL
mmetsp:Transcript_44261/g.49369  ORF Transcript_44261/g.49369 Transcript_44261/m.49369 type:complete len:102 (+) Transcript_44261:658-963(+)